MSETPLSAVVEKSRAQAAIGAIRAEGAYDNERSVYECGSETVAIPVTRPPVEAPVIEVVADAGSPKLHSLSDHLRERGWADEELDRAPQSWAVVGSVILLRPGDCPRPGEVGEALLSMHGEADTVLARRSIDGAHREPDIEVIAGEGDTETVHREHGTVYALDLATVMFSPGNKAERVHMGEVVGDERVLDMFAGIGYFTLPMARAGARVTAVERNPDAFEYLVENVVRNEVTDRVETYRADCRDVVAAGDGAFSFDRVVMGHYDAWEYLDSALAALRDGGMMHMHAVTPEAVLPDRPVGRLRDAVGDGDLEIHDVRRVKTYSEGVVHVVVDATVG